MAIMIPYSEGLTERQRARVAAFDPRSGVLYSLKETAELLDVTSRTVQRWQKNGAIKGFLVGGRWKFPAGEIGRLLHMGGQDNEQ